VAIRLESLGEEDPETLVALNEQAVLQRQMGELEASEVNQRRVLELQRRILGEDHPRTIDSMSNLGVVLYHRGNYADLHPGLSAQRRIFGEGATRSIRTLFNYAYMLQAMGRDDAAYLKYVESADLYRKAFGAAHRLTLYADLTVASLTAERGDPDLAGELIEDVITRAEESLGIDHDFTVSAREALEELHFLR
jgi:hypothetical protein